MNREIKFRAWTKRDKCWCGAFAIHKDGMFRESPNNDWIDLNKQEEIILMQYTGLKDKNGKEIYEGDVVSYLDYGSHSYSDEGGGYMYRKAECRYSSFTGCTYFKCDDGDEHTYFNLLSDQEKFARERESASSAYRNGKFCPELQSIEVIGNIYENPELLA